MNYTHPKEYKGLRFSTPNNQKIRKAYVEANCLKCDKFCGKEHDFVECNMPQDCPKPIREVSMIDPDCDIKCESEKGGEADA